MLKRHADQLGERLDQLYLTGTTFIGLAELYYWYDIERLSKKPWRDIEARWQELLSEKGENYVDPLIEEGLEGFAFFYSENPSKLSEHAV